MSKYIFFFANGCEVFKSNLNKRIETAANKTFNIITIMAIVTNPFGSIAF